MSSGHSFNALAAQLAARLRDNAVVDIPSFAREMNAPQQARRLAVLAELVRGWLEHHPRGSIAEARQYVDRKGPDKELREAFLVAVGTIQLLDTGGGDSQRAQGGDMEVLEGHQIIALGKLLGKTGNSTVHEGDDFILGRTVAVKATQSVDESRLVREAQLIGGLTHPNIPPIHGMTFDSSGRPAYIMPHFKGGRLTDAIRKHHEGKGDGASLAQLLHAVVAAARAAHFAHERGVFHRDIKPDNLLYDESGAVYVGDWGHGCRASDPAREKGVGTFAYAAPEQLDGTGGLAGSAAAGARLFALRRADVYSLGATLYHVVTGQAPYLTSHAEDATGSTRSEGAQERMRRKREGKYVAPERLARAGEPDLFAVIRKAMHQDAALRYDSAEEFARDLEKVAGRIGDVGAVAVKPEEESFFSKARRWVRQRAGVVAGLVVLFALTALIGWGCSAERHLTGAWAKDEAEQKLKQAEQQAGREKRELARKAENEKADLRAGERRKLEQAEQVLADARKKADDDVKEAQRRADEQAKQTKRQADEEVARARREQERAREETAALRRELNLRGLRSEVDGALLRQHGPRNKLSAADQKAVERAADRVVEEMARADMERLGLRREESARLKEYLRRQAVLELTNPRGSEPAARPELPARERVVYDAHTKPDWGRPVSEPEKEFRARLSEAAEASPALLEALRRMAAGDEHLERNAATRLFLDAQARAMNGEGATPEQAAALAAARKAAGLAYLRALLEGKSHAEALAAARAAAADEKAKFANAEDRRGGERAVGVAFGKHPSDEAIAVALKNQHPTADIRPKGGKDEPPPDALGGLVRGPDGPRPPLPGAAERRLPRAEEFADIYRRAEELTGRKGVRQPEYALGYDDIAPGRERPTKPSLFDEILRPQVDRLMPDKTPQERAMVIQRQRGVGSPGAALERSRSPSRMGGFHRVGGASFPNNGRESQQRTRT